MNRIKVLIFVFMALLSFSPDQYAQQGGQGTPIVLGNPSFEDRPHTGQEDRVGPRGWFDCGQDGETAPDVQPNPLEDETYFGVTLKAQHGETYVGMVVRDNNTWEAISQRLRRPMEAGICYTFSLDLARSETYLSISKRTGRETEFTEPAVIRIWGGAGNCNKAELLDETPRIESTNWKTYNFRLEPARNYSYIVIEAFYKTPVMFEYNGNVLIDNASSIQPVPCDEPELASITEPEKKVEPNQKPTSKPKENKPDPIVKTNPVSTPTPAAPKPKELLKELNENVIVGQEIKLDKLYFKADSFTLRKADLPLLDEIYYFLAENRKVVVEIGGHTNNRCEEGFCNALSEERAKSVAYYLIRRGIAEERVTYKGYGKAKPKYPNNTPTNRRKNQRVELKILSTG